MTAAKPTTVWAVRIADYEDHDVVAVFTTRELAEQHAAERNVPRNSCGYEVSPLMLCDHRPVTIPWYIGNGHRRGDGTVTYRGFEGTPRWDYEAQDMETYVVNHPDGFTHVTVQAATPEEARAKFDAKLAELERA